jgi:hypothetical protein
MNMGLGDAYDIGWKLAAIVNGWGGEELLQSYTIERRHVALRNVDRSGVFMSVHWKTSELTNELGHDQILTTTKEAEETKAKIREHVLANDGENKDVGMEMDYRFHDSPVVLGSKHDMDHPWTPRSYFPSTRPGSRAPHVFLHDGKTSMLDLYGPEYTIFDFTENGKLSARFEEAAGRFGVPLERRHLWGESHVHKVWERDVVIVRPDGFVCWRSSEGDLRSLQDHDVEDILQRVIGKSHDPNRIMPPDRMPKLADGGNFTASAGDVDLNSTEQIALLGEFQK